MYCKLVLVSCLLGAASAGYAAPGVATSYAYNSPHGHASFSSGHYNHVAGAPQPVQDTHEVAAAKAEHFKAHAAARSQVGPAAPHYYGSHSVAIGAPQPVQDTHEVAAAKTEHFRAHAAASAHAAHVHYHAAPVSHGYAHAAAPVSYGYSSSVSHQYSHGTPVSHGYAHTAAPVSHGYAHAAPVTHGFAHVGHYGGEARLVDPVAIAAGAPLPVGDTYEVAAAKAAHFKAHAAANVNFGLH